MVAQVEVRTQKIWLDAEGIVHAKLKPNLVLGLMDAQADALAWLKSVS